jgi:hypothetical protein
MMRVGATHLTPPGRITNGMEKSLVGQAMCGTIKSYGLELVMKVLIYPMEVIVFGDNLLCLWIRVPRMVCMSGSPTRYRMDMDLTDNRSKINET